MATRVCCVSGCQFSFRRNNYFQVSLFSLPKDKEMREKWLKSIPNDLSGIKNPLICEKHFLEEYMTRVDNVLTEEAITRRFDKKVLRKRAVPTIFSVFPASIDLKEKTEEPIEKCKTCDKTFHNVSNLKSHHCTGEKSYVCEHCNKVFRAVLAYKIHLQSHTEETFPCRHCNKSFSFKSTLKVHLRTHIREKTFLCKYCDKAFGTMGNLQTHLYNHTGVKPYQCGLCNQEFSQKGFLQSHLRTHNCEKPFLCVTCNKGFVSSASLKVHLTTLHGVKPYQCEHCNQAFKMKRGLILHRKTHTGEKTSV